MIFTSISNIAPFRVIAKFGYKFLRSSDVLCWGMYFSSNSPAYCEQPKEVLNRLSSVFILGSGIKNYSQGFSSMHLLEALFYVVMPRKQHGRSYVK